MRVLCACVPGYGHLHPMIPMAKALEEAGHQVAVATEKRFCGRAEQAGLTAFPAGIGPRLVLERTMARPDAAGSRPEDLPRFGAQMFAGVAGPAKVAELVDVIDSWQADLVLHGATDFSGPVAADHAGIAFAAHSLGPMFPIELYRLAEDLVAPAWEEWGVEPGPLAGMFRSIYLDICPAALQTDDIDHIGPVARPLRPVPFDAVAGEILPPWVESLAPRPTVYVTLGTIVNGAPGVLEAVVEGLRDEPLNVVVTVGPDRDPDGLGPQPPNVHVERYVPQSLLLDRCDVVVAHGGSGTTLAALSHGLPLLVLPQGANQFGNAERCAALGVGVRLLPGEVDPESVRREVRGLLDRRDCRDRAGQMAADIAAMPAPQEVVTVLEQLAVGSHVRRP